MVREDRRANLEAVVGALRPHARRQVVTLLALSDEGAPAYEPENAAAPAALGVPAFACTPDAFGELMAAAIERRDLVASAERHAGA